MKGFDNSAEGDILFGVAHAVAEGENKTGVEVVFREIGRRLGIDVELCGRPRANLHTAERIEHHATDSGTGVHAVAHRKPRHLRTHTAVNLQRIPPAMVHVGVVSPEQRGCKAVVERGVHTAVFLLVPLQFEA